MEVEAINEAGAQVGDRVLISFETGSLIKVLSLVYIFPILALLGGAILGQKLAPHFSMDESLASVIAGFVCFFGAFRVVKSRGNQMAQQTDYQPKIVQILPPAQ